MLQTFRAGAFGLPALLFWANWQYSHSDAGVWHDGTVFLQLLVKRVWEPVKDGNGWARSIFDRHYSRIHYRDGRKPVLFVGPGEKTVLVTPDMKGLFIWRKFIDDCIPKQDGINCAVFRNEGAGLSSDLIRAAEVVAWERWSGERLYTYVDPSKTRHKRDPGRCFLKAGWRHAGWTKGGLRILEKLPGW